MVEAVIGECSTDLGVVIGGTSEDSAICMVEQEAFDKFLEGCEEAMAGTALGDI